MASFLFSFFEKIFYGLLEWRGFMIIVILYAMCQISMASFFLKVF